MVIFSFVPEIFDIEKMQVYLNHKFTKRACLNLMLNRLIFCWLGTASITFFPKVTGFHVWLLISLRTLKHWIQMSLN